MAQSLKTTKQIYLFISVNSQRVYGGQDKYPPPHPLNFLVIGSPPNKIYFQEIPPLNIKKYGFTSTTKRKIKKMASPSPPR